eukprot:scaffold186691_cov28-Tisochrysis_lutea.AAC.2
MGVGLPASRQANRARGRSCPLGGSPSPEDGRGEAGVGARLQRTRLGAHALCAGSQAAAGGRTSMMARVVK